jgi:hypothetical protein
MSFGGGTFDDKRDGDRLRAQLNRVYKFMHDGVWRTLEMISRETGDPEASVSARLRDFRKSKFGGHTVERQYISNGLWRYRLLVRKSK